MTPTLSSLILSAAALPAVLVEGQHPLGARIVTNDMRLENARLAPLLSALARVAEAADVMAVNDISSELHVALTSLRAVCDGQAGGVG